MNKKLLAIPFAAVLAAGLITAANVGAQNRSARTTLATADGTEIGTVVFKTNNNHTEVRVRLTGAPGIDAFHGFHIHANDVVSDTNGEGCVADPAADPKTWFVSADGHYNPTGEAHARHVGDMPVVYVNADGSVETRFQIDKINPSELNGKVVILHAAADNFNNIPLGASATQYTANSAEATAATAKTGNAGDRLACGVIASR